MKLQTSATVSEGQLILDQPLSLPNASRVQVTVEPDEDWRSRFRAGLDEFLRLNRERPIKAGVRFSREELYDRG